MPRPRLILLSVVCFIVLFSAACGLAPEELLPTKGVESLPQDLPTFTPPPSLTPPPTKIFLTPTSLYDATATVPVLYTADPGTPVVTQGPIDILLYEDTGDIGLWVKEALDKIGAEYTYVSGSGGLLKQLQSDTKWDLIIIAAENKAGIQGDMWELLNKKVTFENASLIVEMWSIHLIAEGKIKPFLQNCGVELQKNLPKAVPIYFLDPQHPIFNEPNSGFTLEKANPYWGSEAVDLMKLAPNSLAKLLAGSDPNDTTSGGMITTCFQGRVILQTFLNHDYPKPAISALWQNYINYMLQRRR